MGVLWDLADQGRAGRWCRDQGWRERRAGDEAIATAIDVRHVREHGADPMTATQSNARRGVDRTASTRASGPLASGALAAVLLSMGCAADTQPPARDEWRMVLQATILERPEEEIGLPSVLTRTATGDFLVSDAQQGSVWRIGRDGTVQRRYGARGSGPGEFQQPGVAAQFGDTVVVVNGVRRRLVLFDAASGTLRGEVAVPNGTRQLLTVQGKRHLVTLASPDAGIVRPLVADIGIARVAATLPGLLREMPMLSTGFDGAVFTQVGNELLSVFQVADSVYRLRLDDSLLARAEQVPVRVRYGARAELLRRAPTDPEAAAEAAYGTSIPMAISSADGRLRILYYDPERVGTQLLGRYILAWQTPAGWCEAELPFAADPRPAVSLSGDTVFALRQIVYAAGVTEARLEGLIRNLVGDRQAC